MGGQFMGSQLKKARAYRKLSQSDLAEMIGALQYEISRYENDQRRPLAETLHQIARALRLPMDYFFTTDHPADWEKAYKPDEPEPED